MENVLDNPIWYGLNSGNFHLGDGNDLVRFFPSLITTFVGMKEFTPGSFRLLYDMFPCHTVRATFTPGIVPDVAPWELIGELDIYQMIHDDKYTHRQAKPQVINRQFCDPEIVPLTLAHVPAMLQLTKLTNPGPFNTRTIEFGNFRGVINAGELLAMAGQRLQVNEFAEISAVCTHPSHTGKGYARWLLMHQVELIRSTNRIPILHVKTDNQGAISLYEGAGFRTRRVLKVIIVKKT